MRKILLIVVDGLGIGELPDAGEYGDTGSNTLGNITRFVNGLKLPNLQALGLGFLGDFKGIERPANVIGCFGRMSEISNGKDSTSGHWEMMGVPVVEPFPVYPDGFPPEVINAFETAIGKKILGNKPASGTEIIKELGPEHIRTGSPIVYTSADSVFQIAAHEEVVPLRELYRMCGTARDILRYPHNVGRVIARPFIGKSGSFTRTAGRKDYSIPPLNKTVLEYVAEAGMDVISIGKVTDIFAGKGFTHAISVSENDDSLSKTLASFKALKKGLVFETLVDFDTLYGHRNNAEGYARALAAFDSRLSEVLDIINEDSMLIITADHGCDPTTTGTDHSREYVPLLVYGPSLKAGVNLGIRQGFSDVGATVLEALSIKRPETTDLSGRSFWQEISRASG